MVEGGRAKEKGKKCHRRRRRRRRHHPTVATAAPRHPNATVAPRQPKKKKKTGWSLFASTGIRTQVSLETRT